MLSLESSNDFRSVTFIIFDFLLAGAGLSANEALVRFTASTRLIAPSL